MTYDEYRAAIKWQIERVLYAESQKAEADRLRRNAARGWPDWARDRVYTEIDVRPSVMDRLRILLSGRLLVSTTMYVDKEISHTKQEPSLASCLFPWERWRLQRQARRGYVDSSAPMGRAPGSEGKANA